MQNQDWQLDWIPREKLVEIVQHRFERPMQRARKVLAQQDLRTDPTLNIIRAFGLGWSEQEIALAEKTVAITKTFQNAIGDFHQDVLGAVEGFSTTGTSGGKVDIRGTKPIPQIGGKKIIAEVKMRYNTIKASDEKNMWDDLDTVVRSYGTDEYAAYLIQIIPSDTTAYDQPWKVSGRQPKPYVRHMDGVTAYAYFTGVDTALYDLLQHLPAVFATCFATTPAAMDPQAFVAAAFAGALPPAPASESL